MWCLYLKNQIMTVLIPASLLLLSQPLFWLQSPSVLPTFFPPAVFSFHLQPLIWKHLCQIVVLSYITKFINRVAHELRKSTKCKDEISALNTIVLSVTNIFAYLLILHHSNLPIHYQILSLYQFLSYLVDYYAMMYAITLLRYLQTPKGHPQSLGFSLFCQYFLSLHCL